MIWALPQDPEELLTLALDYPYEAPEWSYLLRAGALMPLSDRHEGDLFEDRHAVVAHGSNRAPEQLLRKFGSNATIPVTYGWLSGYDVVFGAHIARYGAITSTLAAVPGCQVRIAITWLTRQQLARMHQSERMNYSYGHLPALAFMPEVGPRPETMSSYVGNRGALLLEGGPVGLEAVQAQGRPHIAMTQRLIQQQLIDLYLPGRTVMEVILERVSDADLRAGFAARLPGSGIENLGEFEALKRLDGLLE